MARKNQQKLYTVVSMFAHTLEQHPKLNLELGNVLDDQNLRIAAGIEPLADGFFLVFKSKTFF